MKILFVMFNANYGGIQSALLNQLKTLINSSHNIEIDIFLFKKSGPLLESFKKYAFIYPEDRRLSLLSMPFSECFSDLKNFFAKLFLGLKCKIFDNEFVLSKYIPHSKHLDVVYDVAISYSQNCKKHNMYCGCNSFVLNNVKARFKYCFIHGDYKLSGINVDYYNKEIKMFDKVFCVSNSCKNKLLSCLPLDNCYVIRNSIDCDEIIKLSRQDIDIDLHDCFKPILLSVSRITAEKGLIRGLECMSKINMDFTWVIIGDGPLLKQAIKEYGSNKKFIFLGYQNNPFKYMRICDYLFLCSYYEAAPMVIDEAHVLGKHVIMTNCSSSEEQLSNGDYIISNTTPLNSEEILNIFNGSTKPVSKNFDRKENNTLIDFIKKDLI